MKMGFTGTQAGMTNRQRSRFAQLLDQSVEEFHHGDCIGADEEAHKLTRLTIPDTKIVIHPPSNTSKQAFCASDEIRAPKPYLDRNHDIVDETDELIATPKGFEEELRSGTWATVRYARRKNKKVTIIWPDGRLG